MKAVILAGGLGSRISEETALRPKPMIEIGGRPVLWHIMKIYSAHGINDFIICLGYKGYVIKEYFANYMLHMSDIVVDFANGGTMQLNKRKAEPWRVTLIDTGEDTQIGGRIKRILPYIEDDTFLLTYGDGVADIDIKATIDLHRKEGRLATVTGAQPPGRYGAIASEANRVTGFREKPLGDGGWINAGYFVLSPKIGDYIDGDASVWEREPMEKLAADNQMSVYFHKGFWQPMDTLRDKRQLEELYDTGKAPWKVW
jgi:glucose-1-phosphate cytidylyltransferase